MTTHDGTLLPFADAIRVEAAGPNAYAAELQASWSSLVGIHGGYTAAVAARAVAVHVDDPTKPLRSASVQFVSPPDPGPATVLVDVERSGRTASFVRARVVQGDRLRLLLTAICATTRDGAAYDDVAPPLPPRPVDGATAIFPPAEAVPHAVATAGATSRGHFPNADLLVDPSTVPFAGGAEARLAGWIRPLAGEPPTIEWMVCVADFMPPTVFTRLTGPSPAATLDYSVHVLVPDPAALVGADDWVVTELGSKHSSHGYAVEEGRLWAPDGTTLAVTHQLRLAG